MKIRFLCRVYVLDKFLDVAHKMPNEEAHIDYTGSFKEVRVENDIT